jgi:hypothetical protein
MRTFLVPAALVFLALATSGGHAAQIGGGGGLSFDCSAGRAPDGQCVCTPPRDSQDCRDMAQYCEGEITCGWAVDDCWCNQKSIFSKAILKGKVINLPTTGVRDPGSSGSPVVNPRLKGTTGTFGGTK